MGSESMLTFGSLFAGVGGFDLGFQLAGMRCLWQVEIDDYANRVLQKHWPSVPRWRDVRTFPQPGFERPDVICGGFPCTDISAASSTRAGLDGKYSGLWSEYLRIVRSLGPRFVVVENSSMLLVRGFDRLLIDLAASGYDAEWRVFSAYEFGAPHERERVYIVAYANAEHGKKRMGSEQDGTGSVFGRDLPVRLPFWLQAASEFIGMDDGVSSKSYRNRVGCLGNAVVPQIAEWIGKRIVAASK